MVLSACIDQINFQAFFEDPQVKGVIDAVEAANKVAIHEGSDKDIGTLVAGNGSISGLTPGKYYMIEEYYDNDLTRSRFIKPDGDHVPSLTEIGPLTGDQIINLKNNLTYKVKAAKPFDVANKKYEYFAFGDAAAKVAEVEAFGGVTTATVIGSGSYYFDVAAVISPSKLYEVMMIPASTEWGAASRTNAQFIGLPGPYTSLPGDFNNKYNMLSETGVYQFTSNVTTGGVNLLERSIIGILPGVDESAYYVFAEYSNKYTEKRSVTNFVFIQVVVSATALPPLAGTVTIDGTITVGQTLTANTGGLNYNGAAPGTLTYQWNRGGTAIPGATSSTYILVAADVDSSITLTVKNSGNSGSVTSAPITFPAFTGTVSITGTPEVGQTLTANIGSLTYSGTLTYQWKRDLTNIGTNSTTYTLVTADEGSNITVTVTSTGNSGSVTSDPVGPVTFPALTGTVSIDGTAEVGQTLTANTGSLGGSGGISYQWKSGASSVGTNSATYMVQATDVGNAITVTVTRAENTGSITSDPTSSVPSPSLPALGGSVTITGTTVVGQTLGVNTIGLNYNGGTPGVLTYQWKRNGANITLNGTASTYTLVADDKGKNISVTVANPTGNTGSVTSGAVGPVKAPSTVANIDLSVGWTVLTGTTASFSGTCSYTPSGSNSLLDISITATVPGGATSYSWYCDGVLLDDSGSALTKKYSLYNEMGYTVSEKWFQTGTHTITLITDKGSYTKTFTYP